MKKLFTLFFLCLLSITANAQSWQWAKQNTSGFMFNYGAGDPYEYTVTPPQVAADAFGNVYMFGTYSCYNITFGAYSLFCHGVSDGFLAKYDALGNVKWLKGFSGISPVVPPNPYINTNGIATDPSGNIYIIGDVYDTAVAFNADTLYTHNPGGFLFKIDSNGNSLWAKNTAVNAITTDTKGNLYVIGNQFTDSVVLGSITLHATHPNNQYFAKYDSLGTIIWAKTITADSMSSFTLNSITTDTFQNVILGGYAQGSVYFDSTILPMVGAIVHNHLFYAKYNSLGNFLWAKSAGGENNDGITRNSIATDDAGNIYMAGGSQSTSIIFDTYTFFNTYHFFVKLNGMGNLVWLKNSNDSLYGTGANITRDAHSNIYFAGYFSGQAIIGLDTISSLGSSGYIFIKFDSLGNAVRLVTTETNFGINSISANANGNVFITGTYFSEIIIGTTILYNPYSYCKNIFIAKIDTSFPLSIAKDSIAVIDIVVYPNPTNGLVNITSPLFIDNTAVSIYNMVGKLVFTNQFATAYTNQFQIDLHNLPNGDYIISLKTNNTIYNNKITLFHDK